MFDSETILTAFANPPGRVVSLVPSMTESLITFDLALSLVGVSDFCEIPDELEAQLERVGGTKTLDQSKILALKPDLIIANREENDRKVIEGLVAADLMVWLTFPQTVTQAIQDLWHLARLFQIERDVGQRIDTLERILEWTTLVEPEPTRSKYFCPIWLGEGRDWWMTFNAETFASDLLSCCGGINVFADRDRKYSLSADLGLEDAIDPEEKDTRYPRVSLNEIVQAEPDLILLPNEPYPFGEDHLEICKQLMKDTPAAESGSIFLVDGHLITWHGVRIAEALAELPRYFRSV